MRQTAVPLSLRKAPGGRRVPDGFLVVALRAFRAHSAGCWDADTLWPVSNRGEGGPRRGCAGQVSGASAPRAALASVWRVHGALSPLLLLLLLHQELLQRRGSRARHGAGPDGLQALHEYSR